MNARTAKANYERRRFEKEIWIDDSTINKAMIGSRRSVHPPCGVPLGANISNNIRPIAKLTSPVWAFSLPRTMAKISNDIISSAMLRSAVLRRCLEIARDSMRNHRGQDDWRGADQRREDRPDQPLAHRRIGRPQALGSEGPSRLQKRVEGQGQRMVEEEDQRADAAPHIRQPPWAPLKGRLQGQEQQAKAKPDLEIHEPRHGGQGPGKEGNDQLEAAQPAEDPDVERHGAGRGKQDRRRKAQASDQVRGQMASKPVGDGVDAQVIVDV
jgi:hypothetical protein